MSIAHKCDVCGELFMPVPGCIALDVNATTHGTYDADRSETPNTVIARLRAVAVEPNITVEGMREAIEKAAVWFREHNADLKRKLDHERERAERSAPPTGKGERGATPETDAVVDALIPTQFLPQKLIDLARSLERRLSEALDALRPFASMRLTTERQGSVLPQKDQDELKELMEWRDKPIREARALLLGERVSAREWVSVPREPTAAMLAEAWALFNFTPEEASRFHKAMLSASRGSEKGGK